MKEILELRFEKCVLQKYLCWTSYIYSVAQLISFWQGVVKTHNLRVATLLFPQEDFV